MLRRLHDGPQSLFSWRPAPLLVAMLFGLISGCGRSSGPDRATPVGDAPATATEGEPRAEPAAETGPVLELVFPYGSEKENWLEAVTASYNAERHRTPEGKVIRIKTIPMGSGEQIQEILAGRLEAHLVSPASAVFIELGNAESRTRTGGPLVLETQNLVLSPVVIAMWKPMAEAIGWGQKPIGWTEILALAQSTEGWSKYGSAAWGRFKFGHTHPEYSNSGIISLIAEVYAGAGKTRGLTSEDVQKPEVAAFLGPIEKSVVHYGSSTGFFGKKLFENGPEYLSAAVLYENMVIESYGSQYALPFPIVAIYPREGTFWCEHPVAVVERPWVTAEHRAASEAYVKYLLDEAQQRRAMEFGFRPADVNIALAAPLDAAHGIDPQEPKTTLEVPSADVVAQIIDLWKRNKKHARIVLALDISGSMRGEKLAQAKVGAKQLVEMLGAGDELILAPFNEQVRLQPPLKMPQDRAAAERTIDSYFANGGTACYDALAKSFHVLVDQPRSEVISAVVLLSDGKDTHSRTKLADLLSLIRVDAEHEGLRIFTIGYGEDADPTVLKKIADEARAKFFQGTTDNIRAVFKEISTFF